EKFIEARGGKSIESPISIADIYRAVGIEHVSIDVDGTPGSIFFDLNTYAPPPEWMDSFDMVNNEGTLEHLTHIVNGFQITHELLRAGGIARHSMPISACPQHGMFYPTPKFYGKLITENDYELISSKLERARLATVDLDPVFGDLSMLGDDIAMQLVYRKRHDKAFRIPSDLPAHIPDSFRFKIEADLMRNWSQFSGGRFNGDAPRRSTSSIPRRIERWRHRLRRIGRRFGGQSAGGQYGRLQTRPFPGRRRCCGLG